MEEGETSVSQINIGSRNRKNKETKRQKQKKQRYIDNDPDLINFKRACNHNGPTFRCESISVSDVRVIRNRIFENNDKIDQDSKLCHYMSVVPINRQRPTKGRQSRSRNFSVHYFLPQRVSKKKIQVCQAFFLKCVNIKNDRINHIAQVLSEGKIPKEKRGGDHVSAKSVDKKFNVREFIGQLKGKESHYNRKKSKRIYLAADLNIKKLHSMYLSQCNAEHRVNFAMFRRVFVNDFNIGFSSPATDICAKCTRLKYMIKEEVDIEKKIEIRTELTVHKKRANAFYSLLKENPDNSITFCFDLQQIQPLPKTPINDAFYAQQVSMYVFCCVDSKSQNPTFFTWTEDQAGRGSIEVASALLNYLDSLDYKNMTTVRLFCDGCGGQNKNNHIIHTLYFWLRFKAPEQVTKLQIVFPVRGHSFLPADRVFGRVEKLLRKEATILSREEYEQIYEKVGVVKRIGIDWRLFDVKILQVGLKKVKGLSEMKRIVLQKINAGAVVKICAFENFYFNTGTEKFEKLLKPKFSDTDLSIEEKDTKRGIPEKKKKSLQHLLNQQFGLNWENDPDLQWYRTLFQGTTLTTNEEDPKVDEMDGICECLEEEQAVHI